MARKAKWLCLGLFLFAASVAAQGVPVSTTFSMTSDQVEPGGAFVMDINMADNNIAIAGFRIPLKFNEAYLDIDSVSFVGSDLPATALVQGIVDDTGYINIVFLPSASSGPKDSIYASSGYIASVHGRALATTPPGAYPIDSINTSLYGGLVLIRLELSDTKGNTTYLPDFSAGTVSVNTVTGIEDDGGALPTTFSLSQNYPNPFNPATNIEFSLPRAGHVELSVFNVLGQKVDVLIDRQMTAGTHAVEWNASNQPSGIYFYRISTQDGIDTKKMSLIK